MKILHIHTGFDMQGGIESMIIALSNEMAKSYDVTVCSVFTPNDDSDFYTRLSSRVKKIHFGKKYSGPSLKSVVDIYKFLRDSDYDIVHIHSLFYYFSLAVIMLHKKHKFVYTFHSDAYCENAKWDRVLLSLKRFCMKHKWMYPVTISPQSQESFFKLYGLDSMLILNGVPIPTIDYDKHILDDYKVNPSTKVFLHPGRISVPKNQEVLCKVFNRLIEDGFDVMLFIVGNKQDKTIFSKILPYIGTRIIYLGERRDVPQLLSESDGFCLPSIWEGLPVTLLESLSVGCIPICSPVGGIISVIKNGENGLLSNSSSEEDYYNTMKVFLSLSDSQISLMKENCVNSFEPYKISKSSANYIMYYKSLLLK